MYKNVDFGFGIKNGITILKSTNNITDTRIQNFKKGAKKFLSKMIDHLLKNSPIRSPFHVYEPNMYMVDCPEACKKLFKHLLHACVWTQYVHGGLSGSMCMNPICTWWTVRKHVGNYSSSFCMHVYEPNMYMVDCPEACRKLFKHLLRKLVSSKHISCSLADDAKSECWQFLDTIVKKNKEWFMNYDIDNDPLDEFFMEYLAATHRFANVSEIFKFVLTLLHGHAAVERGFSINDHVLADNLQEDNLIAKCFVSDHMKNRVFQSFDVPMTRGLLSNVKSTYSRYN